VVGGNIGRPLFDVWDEMTEQTVAVLELSSFQLQDIRVSPAMAVILMVVPEHLNYHGSVTAYTAAKRQLLRWQTANDRAIINVDYPLSAEMAERTSGYVWRVSHTKTMGAWINGSEVWLCVEQPEVLTTLEQLSMRGQHNLENVAAAGLAAYLLGVPLDVMRQALPAYQPLPHHLALIHQWSGIGFYDDSFATTPEAAAAAVASFDQPLAIIIGGSDKGSDYTPLLKALKRYPDLKGVVTVGEVGPAMADQLRQAGIQAPISQGITDMPTMVKVAIDQLGKQGGIVLLSPAAASFGLFNDYKDRGDQFIAAARQYE
jgi:UDP-N-acetylmuramoylalanine--D-glutamate ligase